MSPDGEIKLYGVIPFIVTVNAGDFGRSLREQPASAAGAALTGGGSQQTGKEELESLKTQFSRDGQYSR